MGSDLAAFAAVPGVLAICETDGRVVAANRPIASLVAWVDEPYRAELGAVLASGAGSVEVHADGAWYQLEVSPADARRAVIGIDISSRKRELERLRRAEAMMVDTQGRAHLGTWEWDPREPTATWSPELYRIYGLTPEEYTPSYEAYLTKVHPDDRPHVMAATEQVFTQHKPYSHDERIFRPDGTIRYLHTWAHAEVDDQGQLVRLIGVCQDITDRKLAELELEERTAALARSQKLEAIGRVTGGIAHDFNNILGVVMGHTALLERRAPDGADKSSLREIMAAVDRAAKLTSQLLAFSSEHSINKGPLDLDRTVDELVPLITQLVGDRVRLRVETGTTPDPLVIEANVMQIEQILMNLAVNARDAMPDGGQLQVTTGTAPDGRALLVVADTGSGMTDEVQAKMFEPFFTTKPGRGTGLGLATVYGNVKQTGGTIDVASAVGRGTRFSISFPRRR